MTTSFGILQEGLARIDLFVGELMQELKSTSCPEVDTKVIGGKEATISA